MDHWAAKEFGGAELGDGRLTKRLIKVATDLADRPTASIPGACSGWVETQYRFFDQANEKRQGLGWEEILTTHMECTIDYREHPLDRRLRAGGRNRRQDTRHPSGLCRRPGIRYSRADATSPCSGDARRLAVSFATQSLPSCGRQTVGGKLWAKVRSGEALGEIEFLLPARDKEAARLVRQKLFACRVELPNGQGGLFPVVTIFTASEGSESYVLGKLLLFMGHR